MNYIILAQTIIQYTNINFTQYKKKYENYISSNYEKLFKKTSSLISYTILVYLDIQK